ncbi:uncharacterized protein BN467_00223 [Prevotella sp. CAG:1124]|nr:uncharacterized protein BN467_00223 [Prevotella sp. CAG:1124]
MAMAYRHRRVAVLFLHHKLGHRLAYDVASSEYHALFARSLYSVTVQQSQYAERRSRDKARQAYSHTTNVDWMETVYVLAVVDSHYYLLLVDMFWQRQLHYVTVNIVIFVKFLDFREQLLFRNVILKTDKCTCKAACLTCYYLVLDVSLATAVMSYEHGRKMRTLTAISDDLLNFLGYFFLYLGRRSLAVYQFIIHNTQFIIGDRPDKTDKPDFPNPLSGLVR